MTWIQIVYIALGGAAGAVTRALVGHWFSTGFPWATLIVNIVGSFIIGIVLGWEGTSSSLQVSIRSFVAIGFCGALTTFSTFSFQTISLFKEGHLDQALYNIFLSVLLTLLAVWLGVKVAQSFSVT